MRAHIRDVLSRSEPKWHAAASANLFVVNANRIALSDEHVMGTFDGASGYY